MLLHIIYLNRTERAKAYVKRYMGNIYPLGFHLLQKLFGEMQSCCRGCCGTLVLCINGLVTVLVLQLVGDVRRKRHLSKLIQNLLKDSFIMELDHVNNLSL